MGPVFTHLLMLCPGGGMIAKVEIATGAVAEFELLVVYKARS